MVERGEIMDLDIEKLLQNEDFVHAMENAQDCAEAAEVFKRFGVDVSEEELRRVCELGKNGELSEDALESVAGGVRLGLLLPFVLIPVPIFLLRKR